MIPDLTDSKQALVAIETAAKRLHPHVHRTPMLTCRTLSERAGVELTLKCESFQRGGAFKIRGALNKTLALTPEERARGLVAHSSGNHAQGVALAARIVGTHAVVVMPEHAPEVKILATRGYGATIELAGQTEEDRRRVAETLQRERGLTLIPPFDDPFVICGAGTVGLEIAQDAPQVATVLVPIGGGGLISGVALAIEGLSPATRVIGVEPAGAATARAAFDAGRIVRLERTASVADGLLPLAIGEHNWGVIQRLVDDVVTVTDDQILAAVRLLLERAKLVVEPSGAATVAAALAYCGRFRGPVTAVVSGGNIRAEALAQALTLAASSR